MDNQGFQLDHRPTKKKNYVIFPFCLPGCWVLVHSKGQDVEALFCSLLFLPTTSSPMPFLLAEVTQCSITAFCITYFCICASFMTGAMGFEKSNRLWLSPIGCLLRQLLDHFIVSVFPPPLAIAFGLCLACSEKIVLFLYPSSVVFETTVNTDTIRCGVHITSFSPTSALSLDRVWTQHFSNSQRKKCQRCYCVAV